MATIPFTKRLINVAARLVGGREQEMGTVMVSDQIYFASGLYPQVECGPLGLVRAIDGNTLILNRTQLDKLHKLEERGILPQAQISVLEKEELYIATWKGENHAKK